MKLTIYLLRDSVIDLSSVILTRYKEKGDYIEIEPTTKLPFPCRAWLQRNKSKTPRWLGWLSRAFDLQKENLTNQSNSFVLVLEAANRRFAVTFGYGFNVIDRTFVEPDFGLKVTLNVVNPESLDMLDTRTLDRITKQTRTHLNAGRPLEDFGIEPDLDWLRLVRGTSNDVSIEGKVEGSDAFRVTWDKGIETLDTCCRSLYDSYRSENYKQNFGFVDHLRRLPATDPLVKDLEVKVLDLLAHRDKEWLAIAHPDVPSPEIETFEIWCGDTKQKDIEELDLEVLFLFIDKYIDENCETPDFQKIWIISLDAQGEARSQKTALWKYLVAHIEHENHIYVLSLGQWFQTDKSYLDELRKKVAAIEDVTDDFNCPTWPKKVKEEDYNVILANKNNWLLLDRKMFRFGNSTNKIECADLLTSDFDFVHVKCMTSSATMSHLFAQGAVSARLYRIDQNYREKIVAAFRGKYNRDGGENSRVVYAIGTSKKGSIAESLFFFSLVNLVQHNEILKGMGIAVSICKIERK